MDTPIHTYAPLPSEFHIRILVLEPAPTSTAPLHGTFELARLTEIEGTYEAISYTWGKPIMSQSLYCDDKTQIRITQSLDDALRRVRFTGHRRRLWADAVCIDQSNTKDKGVQIPRMKKIFRSAKKVLAWLGPGGNGEEEAINLLVPADVPGQSAESDDPQLSEDETKFASHTVQQDAASVQKLVELPFFSRMWIIQEIVFNMDVLLLCGDAEISWQRFRTGLSIYKFCFPITTTLLERLDAIAVVSSLWEINNMVDLPLASDVHHLEVSSDKGIIDLLTKFASYECTDPRDRIFALYS
ncbi:heterokaryon incompatibility protein-domain-containing protein, partial [Dendryphion nanum]